MDDVAAGQIIGGGDFCRSGRASAESPAFLKQTGTCGTVNGTVDTAAAEQSGIGGIDNCINIILYCYVTGYGSDNQYVSPK